MTRLETNVLEKRLLNVKEIADYIGTTPLNIYQMVSKNQIPFLKVGRSTRFDRADIDRWIDGKKSAVQDIVLRPSSLNKRSDLIRV